MANTILATLSLLCAVIVTNLYHHDASSQPPKWLRTLTRNYLSPALRLPIKADNDDVEEAELLQPINKPEQPITTGSPSNGTANNIVDRPISVTAADADDKENRPRDEAFRRIQSEWMTIGAVFDRLFFVAFLTATLIVAVGMLGIYPLCGAPNPSDVQPIRL